MAVEFNKIELDVATEVVNIGLIKAADSLSFFTKEKVLIRGGDIVFSNINNTDFFEKEGDEFTMLSTQLRGDVEGNCYLIFNEEEVDKLAKISLPENIVNNPSQFEEMKEAILLEADNIITAAVVTQFSNLLEKDMHGYIPFHFEGKKEEIIKQIRKQADTKNTLLHFKAHLVSDGNDIVPEFVWCLDQAFVEAIKAFVNKKEYLSKLRELL